MERTLLALKETAGYHQADVMPALLECARAHVSEGEIIGALQDVAGSCTETPIF